MIFTIELVASTKDTNEFIIAGFLAAEAGETNLMKEMTESLQEILDESDDFRDHIRIKEDKIIYNAIPVSACSNILKVLQRNLDIKIRTVVSPDAKYIPNDCKGLFNMKLVQLFN